MCSKKSEGTTAAAKILSALVRSEWEKLGEEAEGKGKELQ